jgi:hypothetical protein
MPNELPMKREDPPKHLEDPTAPTAGGIRQERLYFLFGRPTGTELSADEFADRICTALVRNGAFDKDGKCLLRKA